MNVSFSVRDFFLLFSEIAPPLTVYSVLIIYLFIRGYSDTALFVRVFNFSHLNLLNLNSVVVKIKWSEPKCVKHLVDTE